MKIMVPVPTINANDAFVVIVRWLVADGAAIERGLPLVDVETTKAVVTIESEHAGWVQRCCREGDEVAVGGDLLAIYSTAEELAAAGPPAPAAGAPVGPSPPSPEPPPASPLSARAQEVPAAGFTATRLSPAAEAWARAQGWALADLASQKLGLVTRRSLEGRRPAAAPAAADDGLRRERVPPAKRAEIQALLQGAGEHLRSSLTLYFDSAPLRAGAPGESILPIILADVASLLRTQPKFTAFYDQGKIAFHDAVHLGIALDLGQGLRVVTVRDADRVDAAGFAGRLADLALGYLENRLAPAEVQGATFTVTDLSAFDVLQFEPLINARQSAILAIGGDATLPGYPMSLTLAFDHRVANGREAGEFLQALRRRLTERPVAPPAPPACDRCLIDLPTYYAKFGNWGVMHQYLRPDGSAGLLCHSCLATF